MKKYFSRIIAGVLLTAMIVTCVPMEATLAAETNVETEESVELNQDLGSKVEADTSDQGGEEDGLKESEESLKTEIEQEKKPEESAVKEDSADSEDKESENETKQQDEEKEQDVKKSQAAGEIEEKVNFVYIESPYLETPGTQRIVFAFESALSTGEEITLTVEDEAGNQEDWPLAKQKDGVYLFEKEYSSEAVADTYHVVSLNLSAVDKEEVLDLSEQGIEAEFGVNREYDGIEDLEPIEEDLSEVSEDVEASVVTIDENGVAKAQDSIADALDTVSAQTQAAGISTLSTTSAKAATSRSGNIIVALDPGHDSRSTGASANGLKEEVLTLKIANYCKEELEKYAGVEVYMTRTGADCPFKMSGSGCIKKRVNAAADAGAQIFVSFHLNSSTSTSAKGAEVIVQNNNWKPSVGTDSKELGQAILDELVKVGLSDRGIYTKNAQQDKYENGSAADYYAVNRYSKLRGIPGIIIEHAFISNKDDANKYLKTESGLKKLGVADATGIAKYLGLSKIGDKVSIEEGTYMLVSALDSDKVATVTGGSTANGTPITLNDNDNISAQRFEITSVGNGYYNIVAEHSGKAMDVKGGSAASGTMIQQYTNKNVAAQKWGFVDAGDGYYYICSSLGTFLDVKSGQTANGTQIQGYSYNGTTAQKWKLVKSDYRPVEDGTYTISSSLNKKMVVDVESGSIADKQNIQLSSLNNSSSQRYEIRYVADGYYSIRAEHSSKALDVVSGSGSNGTNIQQYTWKNVDAQLWKFIDAGNGNYYVRSKCGNVMAIEGEQAVSGANVYTWEMDFENDQKWNLTKTEYRPVEDGTYVISSYKANGMVATEKDDNLQLEGFASLNTQRYNITYVGEGYYKILLEKDGKALDVEDGSSEAKANVQVHKWNGTAAQLWKFIPAADETYYIKSKLGTTMELASGKTIAGTNIQMYTVNGSKAQRWVLDKDKAALKDIEIEEGTYTIKNATGTNQVLEVKSGSTENKGSIQTYKSNDTSAQHFEITSAGDGYYRIQAEHSSKVLDVKDGSFEAGASIQQYKWNGTEAQLWKFIDAGEGKCYIQSKKGTVVDLAATTAVSGTKVETDYLNGEKSQQWILEKTEYRPVEDGTYVISSYKADGKVATEEEGNLQLAGFVNGDTQKYKVSYVGEGYYKIVLEKDGKVLEVKDGSSEAKANAQLGEWKGTNGQLWKFATAAGGTYYIKSKLGTTMELASGKTTAGTNIQMYTVNGSEAQRWVLDKDKAALKDIEIEEGTYTIKNATGTNQVLDIKSGSKSSGAIVQTYKSNNTLAQRFKISKEKDGYYRITAEHSGLVFDVKGGSFESGASIQQYKWNGTEAQLWKFIDAGDGKCYIQSKKGTILDLGTSTAVSGTKVQTAVLREEKTQKWILEDVENLYSIMGKSDTSVKQMAAYFKSKNTNYPYSDSDAPTIEDFCQMYLEECEVEGVKAEVAFCQAMLETGFLKFGGDVDKDQYNFAGLGATGNGVHGESFPTVRIGIRAQVQHLKAYASTEPLKQACVDTRFKYVTRGCAPYVQWLGIKENPNSLGWASSKNYGYNIVNLYILPMKLF